MKTNAVTVEQFYADHRDHLGLRLLAGADGLSRVIREPTVNRPGLVVAGFTKYFAHHRVQAMGNAETFFLKTLSRTIREERYRLILEHRVPCLVFTRNLNPERALLRLAEQHGTAVFKTPAITMNFISRATIALESLFAPSGTEIGTMVDILGIGVIIRGESGIGKSECVLGLIERGYSLVSDDITKVVLLDGTEVIGKSSGATRHFMEVRGIGIINVLQMFGVRSVRDEKRVDLVVTLKSWEKVVEIERVGLDQDHVEILGVKVPHVTIPVRPGRDLARLVEVAAFQSKLRQSGFNPAKELNDALMAQMGVKSGR